MPDYHIIHDTTYRYASRVTLSQQIAHLHPRELPTQRCTRHRLDITPPPSQVKELVDFFGNPTTHFSLGTPHGDLRVHAESWVAVDAPAWPEAAATPPWEAVRDALSDALSGSVPLSADTREAGQYRCASPYVALGDHLQQYADYAAESFTPGRPLLEAVLSLCARIHVDFSFDADATSVATPVERVFAERRGVCQDFSHLMIACLRALGLAARYVSGYLLTEPPPGQPRLVGADASHAWLAVWCPGAGWLEVDPTNDVQPVGEHITLAWGRDYGDVCPLHGVILGGGDHTVDVAVTVRPLAREDAPK
jgi:transglutaminase-like putative cysteine protease